MDDPDAIAIGELFRKAQALNDAPPSQPDQPLREGEILPKKFRRAVTRADQCNWCDEPFIEPKRKRFVIIDHDHDDVWSCFGLRSICFECWKWGHDNESNDHGIKLERFERKCQGCGEPMSIPCGGYRGTWRWFNWGVCSMRCYQRTYRKRRRRGGGSSMPWKGKRRREICEACKRPLPEGQRRDGRFCSNRCRQWMYRRRHARPLGG